ncbi:DNA-binding protein rfx6 [Chamberlinius hualienensis]
MESSGSTEWDKQNQLTATLQWVESNYEWCEGVCVPRCLLYQHYQDFCLNHGFTSVGAATFGKVIRQRFPKLTTRRLGTRGQSRYHYYGIGIKPSSQLYEQTYVGNGLSRFSRIKVKTADMSSVKNNEVERACRLLPEFPSAEELLLADDAEERTIQDLDKLKIFLIMYRTHSQRILDAIVAVTFQQIENLLMYFWREMPSHMFSLLQHEAVVELIAICDVILYKIINDVLIPSTIQDMPESLCNEISNFINNFDKWLNISLQNCPVKLKHNKNTVAIWFVTSVKRQLSFIRLAQISRSFLSNVEQTRHMVRDLSKIDLNSIISQLSIINFSNDQQLFTLMKHAEQLMAMLEKQTNFEDLMDWVDRIVRQRIMVDDVNEATLPSMKQFLLCWTYATSVINRDLTLLNCKSFGNLHILSMLLSEYVYLVMETQSVRLKWRSMRCDFAIKYLKTESSFARLIIGLNENQAQQHQDGSSPCWLNW